MSCSSSVPPPSSLPEAAVFWATENSILDLEMLSAPASFQDIEADLAGLTTRYIYTMQVMPFEHKKDSFSAVVGIGEQMGPADWLRCT